MKLIIVLKTVSYIIIHVSSIISLGMSVLLENTPLVNSYEAIGLFSIDDLLSHFFMVVCKCKQSDSLDNLYN